MEPRNIKLKLLTQTKLEVINTTARTLADFKKEISASSDLIRKFGISDADQLSNVDFVDRETKALFSIDSAVLPPVDCILFVSLRKNKFGAQILSNREIDSMTYNELRSYASKLNRENGASVNMSGTKDSIRKEVLSFLNKTDREVSNHIPCGCASGNCSNDDDFKTEVMNKLAEATNCISAAMQMVGMLEEIVHEVKTEEGVVIHLTEQDLDDEAAEINAHLHRN